VRKSKIYYNVRFGANTLENFYKIYVEKTKTSKTRPAEAIVHFDEESWQYDTIEEFLTECPKANHYVLRLYHDADHTISIQQIAQNVKARIEMPNRNEIEALFLTLERDLEKSRIKKDLPAVKAKAPIKIFIGHGRNPQWRDLKDHLHEKHGFDVEAYEIGPRAGQSVKEVLQEMLNESTFALLVLTGEDEKNDGELHARENVIHELGLFQGRLGFERAIALLEDGVVQFSNIFGINQIRFSKGNIREVYGDVVATIVREFKVE
jgi:predicted nucleotide-binding protein